MLPDKEKLPQVSRQEANKCFACGPDNPIGLKLKFRYGDGWAETEFTPGELYQGWPGIVHGGIICTLLDEAMGYAFYPEGLNAVTAKTEVRFKHYTPIGETILVTASVTKKTKRLIETQGKVSLKKDGTLLAEATALMYILSRE
jgi:acyl-coenzyme A thioesterase PaaI-like protein